MQGLGAMDSEETKRIKTEIAQLCWRKIKINGDMEEGECKGEHVRSVRGLNKSTVVRMQTSKLIPRPGEGKIDGA